VLNLVFSFSKNDLGSSAHVDFRESRPEWLKAQSEIGPYIKELSAKINLALLLLLLIKTLCVGSEPNVPI